MVVINTYFPLLIPYSRVFNHTLTLIILIHVLNRCNRVYAAPNLWNSDDIVQYVLFKMNGRID